MNNQNKNLHLLEIISDDSNNSIEFQATARYISLIPNGISVEKVKSKNKQLYKKKTRVSSNNDEEYSANENNNDNENNNFNIQLTDNNNSNNNCNKSDNSIIISHHNKNSLLYSSVSNPNSAVNKYDKINQSGNENMNDYEKLILKKKSHFSPKKKKRKLILEVKAKNRGQKRSVYALEQKEVKKEEQNKIYRKDKNGTAICKKNKRKVKISFEEPFVNVVPIESFKKYNVMIGIPKGEKYINSKDEVCLCCIIF